MYLGGKYMVPIIANNEEVAMKFGLAIINQAIY